MPTTPLIGHNVVPLEVRLPASFPYCITMTDSATDTGLPAELSGPIMDALPAKVPKKRFAGRRTGTTASHAGTSSDSQSCGQGNPPATFSPLPFRILN